MKAIMISIKPQYVADILNGKKTLEIRKTLPKCELPIEVYIYCTKGNGLTEHHYEYVDENGNPTGEWYKVYDYGLIRSLNGRVATLTSSTCSRKEELKSGSINGKVVAKFTLNKVEEIVGYNDGYDLEFRTKTMDIYDILHNAGFANNPNNYEDEYYEFCKYLKNLKYEERGIVGYAWHIGNLVVFDKPKEISEFKTWSKCQEVLLNKDYFKDTDTTKFVSLTHAPQNYMFIEIE